MLLPGRGSNMGDGWETKRSRAPNHSDHVVIRLGDKGRILKVEIDTSHYKGNYPNKIMLEAALTDAEVPDASAQWSTLVDPSSVGPHGLFYFDPKHTDKVFSHARITIIPGKLYTHIVTLLCCQISNFLNLRWRSEACSFVWCSRMRYLHPYTPHHCTLSAQAKHRCRTSYGRKVCSLWPSHSGTLGQCYRR